jgi:hypothetical protein
MGTEEDKPNNGVLITLFVIGSAAMLGGSAAIVGMTRTEMDAQRAGQSAYADLDSVRELSDAQRKALREAELPIDRAQLDLLADIQRNPHNASWATPVPTEEAGGAGGASAGSGGQAAGGAAVGPGGEHVGGASPDSAAGGEASAPDQEEAVEPGATGSPVQPTPPHPQTPPKPRTAPLGARGGASPRPTPVKPQASPTAAPQPETPKPSPAATE